MEQFVAIAAAVILIVTAVFAALTWPALFRRVARDPRARDENGAPTTFYTVHRNLTAAALTLAGLGVVSAVLVLVYLV